MKFLLWGIIAAAVVIWLMHGKKKAVRDREASARASQGAEPMVSCAFCGTYVPVSESVAASSGLSFCNEEHRLRHVERNGRG